MGRELGATLEALLPTPGGATTDIEVGKEVEEELRSLGYLP